MQAKIAMPACVLYNPYGSPHYHLPVEPLHAPFPGLTQEFLHSPRVEAEESYGECIRGIPCQRIWIYRSLIVYNGSFTSRTQTSRCGERIDCLTSHLEDTEMSIDEGGRGCGVRVSSWITTYQRRMGTISGESLAHQISSFLLTRACLPSLYVKQLSTDITSHGVNGAIEV